MARKKERKIRPDLRSVSIKSVEDRIAYDALRDQGVAISEEFCIFLRGVAKRDVSVDARLRFLKTLRKGLSAHYETHIAAIRGEMELRISGINEEIELAVKELEKRAK